MTPSCGSAVSPRSEVLRPWGEWLESLAREKRVARLSAPAGDAVGSGRAIDQFRAVWPQAQL